MWAAMALVVLLLLWLALEGPRRLPTAARPGAAAAGAAAAVPAPQA